MGIGDLTVSDKSGTVLMRLRDRSNAGDSLAGQQDIQSALAGKAFAGIITEKTALFAVVAASPIYDTKGAVVGAVSVAFPLDATDYLDEKLFLQLKDTVSSIGVIA